jgi:DNA-binding FadR family transcriptional regulator
MSRVAAQRAGTSRTGLLRSEEAYRRTLGLITEGGLVDGDRLPSETELSARFGISRPLIRQALSRLQAAGVVDVRWGAGSYVRDPGGAEPRDPSFGPVGSLDEVRQSFELRQAVEGDAAALAATHRVPAKLEQARRALAALEHAVAIGAIGQQPDIDFHFAIAAATENPLFERVLISIRHSMEFTINLTRSMALTHSAARRQLVQSEHVAIMAAIDSGDADEARRAMRAHLANSCTRLFLGPGAV